MEIAMPMLIDTPEDWFRVKAKDLYILDYGVDRSDYDFVSEEEPISRQKRYERDRAALLGWFRKNLPATKLNTIGSSEYSGWITGGPSYITADFDATSLEVFRSAWSEPESFWKVEIKSYRQWLKMVRSCRLLPTPLDHQQNVRWWDTPDGFILLSANSDERHLSRWDAWWLLPQLVPNMADVKTESLPYGEYFAGNDNPNAFIVIDCGDILNITSWDAHDYKKNAGRIRKLRAALRIPKDVKVGVGISDC